MFSIPHSSIIYVPALGIPYDWSIVTVYLIDTHSCTSIIIIWLHRAQSLTNMLSMWNPPTMVPIDILQFWHEKWYFRKWQGSGQIEAFRKYCCRLSPLSFCCFSLICCFTAHSLPLLLYTDQEPGTGYSSLFDLFLLYRKIWDCS